MIADLETKIDDPGIFQKIHQIKDLFINRKDLLVNLAYKDQLTGVSNRRHFDETLDLEIERVKRYERPLSLIMIDIDHFKKFNDTYGHQKGDEVLSILGSLLLKSCRINDTVARYGGEEFAIILPETDLNDSEILAENLRKMVQTKASKKAKVEITISLGVAEFDSVNSSTEKLIEAADNALYRAKKSGRNRVMIDN